MRWFWKWMHKKIEKALRDNETECTIKDNGISLSAIRDDERSMNFSISAAEGGVIYRQSQYDRKTDRRSERVVIIHDSEDLGERVGQLVQMGMMQV